MIDNFLAEEERKERDTDPGVNRRKGSGALLKWGKRLAIGALGLILVLGVAGFFARGWLLEKGEELLTGGLAKQGYFLGYEEGRVHPLRGIVLKEMKLYETEARETTVLSLSDVGVSLGWRKLLSKRSLEGLTPDVSIRDGVLELKAGEETLTFSQMEADFVVGKKGIEIDQADLVFEGLELRSAGMVKFSGKGKTAGGEKSGNDGGDGKGKPEEVPKKKGLPDLAPLAKLKEWVAIEAEGPLPVLVVDFSVDPDGEVPVAVEGTLTGESFSWRGFPVDSLDAAFGYFGGENRATLSRLEFGYRGNVLSGDGLTASLDSGEVVIGRLVSRIDLARMIGELPIEGLPEIPDIEMSEPPELEVSGRLLTKALAESDLSLRIEQPGEVTVKAADKTLALSGVRGTATLQGGMARTGELEATVFGGRVRVSGEAAVFEKPLRYSGRIEAGETDFQELMAFAGVEAMPESRLGMTMDVSGRTELQTIVAKGLVSLNGDTLSVKAPVEMREGLLRIEGMEGELGGGKLFLTGGASLIEKPLPFELDLRTENVPLAAMAALGGKKAEAALQKALADSGIEVLGSPNLSVKGSGSTGDLPGMEMAVGIDAPAGIKVALPEKPVLTVGGIRGNGTLSRGVFVTEGFVATVFGGAVKVSGKSPVFEKPLTWQARVEGTGLTFEALMAYLGQEGMYPSKLGMGIDVSGGMSLAAITANGVATLAGEGLEVNAPVSLAEGVVRTTGLEANVGGGRVFLSAAANVVAEPLVFQADLRTEAVPIQKLLDVGGVEQEFAGNLSATFKGGGAADPASLNGAGSIRIDNGALYRVPVIGKVKDLLSKAVPTFGKESPANLSTTFVIEDGVIATEDLSIASDLTGVDAAGVFDLGRMWTKFTAQAKVKAGLVSAATNSISKLLEVKGEGPVDDLKIGLSNLDPLTAAGSVKDTIGATKEGLENTANRAKDALKDVKNLGNGGLKGLADKVMKPDAGKEGKGESGDAVEEGLKKVGEGLNGIFPGKKKE